MGQTKESRGRPGLISSPSAPRPGPWPGLSYALQALAPGPPCRPPEAVLGALGWFVPIPWPSRYSYVS